MSIYLGKNKVGITTIKSGNGGDDALVALIEGPIIGAFENSKITKIRDYAFISCSSLITASLSACTTIGTNAF